jgi:type IV pilus assembly protein PilN
MIRINLLAADRPSATKTKKAASTPGAGQAYLLLALFVGGALMASGALYFWKQSQLKALDEQIAQAEARQRQLQDIKRQVEELEQKRATFQRKVDLIEQLKAEQSGPVHLLDEISKNLPEFVWLTSLQQSATGGTRLAGQSNSLTAVADFILALQRSGWFPNVDLVSSTESGNIVTFALSASFKDPANAAREAAAKAKQAQAKNLPPPKK